MGSRGHTWFHRILEVFKVTCAIRIKTVRDVVREVGHRSAVSGNAPQKRSVDTCPLCDESPCHRIEEIARGYITLIPDGKRLKEKGIDDWTKEQEERTKTGFAYADIRYQPYSIPKE